MFFSIIVFKVIMMISGTGHIKTLIHIYIYTFGNPKYWQSSKSLIMAMSLYSSAFCFKVTKNGSTVDMTFFIVVIR